MSQPSDKVPAEKAAQILKDGEANGKPLTAKQERMFQAAVHKDEKAIRWHEHHSPDTHYTREEAEELAQRYRGMRGGDEGWDWQVAPHSHLPGRFNVIQRPQKTTLDTIRQTHPQAAASFLVEGEGQVGYHDRFRQTDVARVDPVTGQPFPKNPTHHEKGVDMSQTNGEPQQKRFQTVKLKSGGFGVLDTHTKQLVQFRKKSAPTVARADPAQQKRFVPVQLKSGGFGVLDLATKRLVNFRKKGIPAQVKAAPPDMGGDPAMGGGDMGGTPEKHSVAFLRKWHERALRDLEELDSDRALLDNPKIDKWAEKAGQKLVQHVEEMESLFGSVHPDAEPLVGTEEANPQAEDTLDATPNDPSVESEVDSEMPPDPDAVGNDEPGVGAESDENGGKGPEPTGEEVAEGMRRDPDEKGLKTKAMECGTLPTRKGPTLALVGPNKVDEALEFFKSISEDDSNLDDDKRLKAYYHHRALADEAKAYFHHDMTSGDQAPEMDEGHTMDMAGGIGEKDIPDPTGDDAVDPTSPDGLTPHKALTRASKFLGLLSRVKDFGLKHREAAGAYHKMLSGVKFVKPQPKDSDKPTVKSVTKAPTKPTQAVKSNLSPEQVKALENLHDQQTKDMEDLNGKMMQLLAALPK